MMSRKIFQKNKLHSLSLNGQNMIIRTIMVMSVISVLAIFVHNIANTKQYNNDIKIAVPSNVQSSLSPTPVLIKSLTKVKGPGSIPSGKYPNNKGWDVNPDSILQDESHNFQCCNWLDFRASTGQTANMC